MTSALVATMATAPHPAPSLFRFLGLLSLLSFKLPVVHFPKKKKCTQRLVGGPVVKNPPCNAGDLGLTLGWGKSRFHMPQGDGARAPHSDLCAATEG